MVTGETKVIDVSKVVTYKVITYGAYLQNYTLVLQKKEMANMYIPYFDFSYTIIVLIFKTPKFVCECLLILQAITAELF